MAENRRIHARVTTRLPARLRRGGESLDGVVENLGQGGAFFATGVLEVAVEDGAEVALEFGLPRGERTEPVCVPGRVLRSERYFDGQAVVRAFAVRFDEVLDLAGLDPGGAPPR